MTYIFLSRADVSRYSQSVMRSALRLRVVRGGGHDENPFPGEDTPPAVCGALPFSEQTQHA